MTDKKNMAYLGIGVAILALLFIAASNIKAPDNAGQATDSSIADIGARGKLVVGINPPYEPLEYFDESGKMVGLDVDIANEIASGLKVTLELKNYEQWDELLNDIKDGKVDMGISGISITPDRSKDMLFSVPYLNNGMVLIARKGDERIKSVNDLRGKKIGTVKESTWESEAAKYTNSSLIIVRDGPTQMLADLKNGSVDAVIYDYVMSGKKEGLLKGETSFAVIGDPFTQDFIGIAASKNSKALMNEVNNILSRMKQSGRLKDIIAKWI